MYFYLLKAMAPKQKKQSRCTNPSQMSAKKITKKYHGRRMMPEKRRALYNVSSSNISLRKAAQENNSTYSFLYRRWKGEVDLYKLKGQSPIFSEAEEDAMANWLCEMSQRGISLRMCKFLDFVQSIVKKEKRQTPFKGGRPGKKMVLLLHEKEFTHYQLQNRNKIRNEIL